MADQGILDFLEQGGDFVSDFYNDLPTRDKVALLTSLVPVVGGVTGTYADVMNMYENPDERNALNYGLLATNFIPGSRPTRTTQNIVEKSKGVEVDPRFGKNRVNDDKELKELQTETEVNTLETPPEVSIFDMEGKPFVTSMADRTEAGKILTKVNDVELNEAVRLRGGQNYMFDKPNIKQGNLWASDKGPVSSLINKSEKVKDGTKQDTLYMPFAMSPTGGDFAHQTTEVMINYADTVLPRAIKTKLNKEIKDIIPGWKGMASPKTQEILNKATPKQRKAVQHIMDKNFREIGLSLPQARVAVTEVDQLADVLPLEARNVGIISGGSHNISNHPTYSRAIEGTPVGKLKEKFSVMDLLTDDDLNKGLTPRNWGRGGDFTAKDEFAFRMRPQGGILTEDKLRHLEGLLGNMK